MNPDDEGNTIEINVNINVNGTNAASDIASPRNLSNNGLYLDACFFILRIKIRVLLFLWLTNSWWRVQFTENRFGPHTIWPDCKGRLCGERCELSGAYFGLCDNNGTCRHGTCNPCFSSEANLACCLKKKKCGDTCQVGNNVGSCFQSKCEFNQTLVDCGKCSKDFTLKKTTKACILLIASKYIDENKFEFLAQEWCVSENAICTRPCCKGLTCRVGQCVKEGCNFPYILLETKI